MSRAQKIEEQAAGFVLRREEPSWSAVDQASLDDWLDESDAHKVAYWRLERGWRDADRIGSLGASESHRPASDFARSRWAQMIALAACLGLFVLGFMTLQPWHGSIGSGRGSSVSYQTAVGGHEQVAMADGSRVELNTDTLIRASAEDRSVWLERGEAFFDVAKAGGRPFVVHAGSRSVTVLGTEFSVRRAGDELTVAVLEGRVRVEDSRSNDAEGRSATISAGHMAIANESGLLLKDGSIAKVRDLLAWRSGRLNFDGVSLGEVASQFNRYNRKQLVIADPEAAKIRIGGSFDARNIEGFARLLDKAYGLSVVSTPDRISVSS